MIWGSGKITGMQNRYGVGFGIRDIFGKIGLVKGLTGPSMVGGRIGLWVFYCENLGPWVNTTKDKSMAGCFRNWDRQDIWTTVSWNNPLGGSFLWAWRLRRRIHLLFLWVEDVGGLSVLRC